MNASLFVPGFPAEVGLSPELLVPCIIGPHFFCSPGLLLGPELRVTVVSLSVVMLGAAYGRLLLCIGHVTGLVNQCYSSKISGNLERKWARDFVVAQVGPSVLCHTAIFLADCLTCCNKNDPVAFLGGEELLRHSMPACMITSSCHGRTPQLLRCRRDPLLGNCRRFGTASRCTCDLSDPCLLDLSAWRVAHDPALITLGMKGIGAAHWPVLITWYDGFK